MVNTVDIGNTGEAIAEAYLLKTNYAILEKNWRYNKGEIDIIAQKEALLIFVEVKTRHNKNFGNPEDSVTQKKKAKLAKTAGAYLDEIDYNGEYRFDIIAINLSKTGENEIIHFEDAFFPTDIN